MIEAGEKYGLKAAHVHKALSDSFWGTPSFLKYDLGVSVYSKACDKYITFVSDELMFNEDLLNSILRQFLGTSSTIRDDEDIAFMLLDGKYMEKDVNVAEFYLQRAANAGSKRAKIYFFKKTIENDNDAEHVYALYLDLVNEGCQKSDFYSFDKDTWNLINMVEFAHKDDLFAIRDLAAYYRRHYCCFDSSLKKLDELQCDDLTKAIISMSEFSFKEGVPRESRVYTLRWHERAAELGDVDAMLRAGQIYYGLNIYEKAAYFYTMAAKNGVVKAMFRLGTIYRSGSAALPADFDKSLYWYQCALDNGCDEAKFWVKRVPVLKQRLQNSMS